MTNDVYAGLAITPEDEKKVKSSLERFRNETKPVLKRFHEGSLPFDEMIVVVKRLEGQMSEDLKNLVGEKRFLSLMERASGSAERSFRQHIDEKI
ncbi:MAG: hypothetical protein WA869_12335 [Alloacidobacterium sp.]|jgi:hypothetical protein